VLALSLAGWSFVVAAVSVAIALAGFLVNFDAIRTERDDRRQSIGDEWAREWGRQRPLVYPRVPQKIGGTYPQRHLKLKNGGRGPALDVEGELRERRNKGDFHWGQLSAGAIAAGDKEVVPIAGPPMSPKWSIVSGVIRYSDLVSGTYVTRFDLRGDGDEELEIVDSPAGAHTGGPEQLETGRIARRAV